MRRKAGSTPTLETPLDCIKGGRRGWASSMAALLNTDAKSEFRQDESMRSGAPCHSLRKSFRKNSHLGGHLEGPGSVLSTLSSCKQSARGYAMGHTPVQSGTYSITY